MSKSTDDLPKPKLVMLPGAVHYTACSRTHLYEAMRTGKLKARKAGRRTLLSIDDLDAYIASLPEYGAGA